MKTSPLNQLKHCTYIWKKSLIFPTHPLLRLSQVNFSPWHTMWFSRPEYTTTPVASGYAVHWTINTGEITSQSFYCRKRPVQIGIDHTTSGVPRRQYSHWRNKRVKNRSFRQEIATSLAKLATVTAVDCTTLDSITTTLASANAKMASLTRKLKVQSNPAEKTDSSTGITSGRIFFAVERIKPVHPASGRSKDTKKRQPRQTKWEVAKQKWP